jgi:hypothetical protein
MLGYKTRGYGGSKHSKTTNVQMDGQSKIEKSWAIEL